ncbi:metallophosphoesterase [Lactiplantibacillus plantarum]|uniref:metallophosphoesterase family protein n=1 Tax=Lactiplantibacillus plantarum TaxID=1590 RepID=UPI000C18DD7B|nr:metallophosphoesterase [Lactiplantibacillus plantarum]PKX51456.1 metallophosphoesterase [Lactiplantibacillus plantarum]
MISTITLDTYKQQISSGDAFNLSDSFNGRVGDEQVPLVVHFKERGLAQQFQDGLVPFLTGFVGSLDENDQVTAETGEAVSYVGTSDDIVGLGRVKMNLPGTMFPQEGYFYGFLGLQNADGKRVTTFNVWFRVYNGNPDMFVNKAPFRTELQKLLDAVQSLIDGANGDLNTWKQKLTDLFTALSAQGADTATLLTTLETKIKQDGLFTQAEANTLMQTLQSTVNNQLDEFQSQFNGPAFKEAQQASLDTNMMYGEALPPYFENSFNHVTQGIPSGNDVINIATIADAHWQEEGATIFDGYTAKSLEHYQWCALSTLYNHADALIALGDNINGDEPTGRLNMTLMHVRSMLQTKHVRTAMFMIRGNHDNGAGHQNTQGQSADEVLDDDGIKNGFGTKLNYYDEVRDGDSLYFYKDFPDKKVRIIGLDSTDIPLEKKDSNGNYAYDTNTAGFRAQQLNWFANKALMLPNNTWQVIVFFHIPFPNAFGQWAEDNSFKNYHNAIAILNAFKNGTSVNINDTSNPDFTISGLQADYSKQGKGTLIAVVNGHLHRDDQDTSVLNGTPIIEVTTSASFVSSIVNDSKQRNTNDEDAWDLISVDTKGHKIHCYRFGRGSDRDFTY